MKFNQISKETSINWKTVDNHLVHLIGKGLVKEVFSSQYVKIVELSDKGKEHIAQSPLRLKGKKPVKL